MSGDPPTALEERGRDDDRLFSPSAARNGAAIADAFLAHMPATGLCVEIGAGTGEHAVRLAALLPAMTFHPGDPDAAARRSIAAWTAHAGLLNIRPPHDADVCEPAWPRAFAAADAVVSINMIHIAPREAMGGLIAGAAALLNTGGRLFLYGPFMRAGAHMAPSNAEFDASLKARDPRWGVRDLDRDVTPLCERAGLKRVAVIAMPANNFSVVFERA